MALEMLLASARTANLYPIVSSVVLIVAFSIMFGGFFTLILMDFVGCFINMGNMVNVLPCSSCRHLSYGLLVWPAVHCSGQCPKHGFQPKNIRMTLVRVLKLYRGLFIYGSMMSPWGGVGGRYSEILLFLTWGVKKSPKKLKYMNSL